jgi:5-methylcytosine-specific restriction endonuclease McrA
MWTNREMNGGLYGSGVLDPDDHRAGSCALNQQVLRTDVAGMPLEWIDYQEAVRLYHQQQVAYTCGSLLYSVRGGHNALTGRRSIVDVNSIIATHGNHLAVAKARRHYVPPLSNPALFRRDAHLCMYCGERFGPRDLSRDHITPVSRGGTDTWTNVVTACKRCNHHKAGRTPEEAGIALLAVPFAPTHAEYIYLQGKRVLVDQLEFLLAHFPRTSPLQKRLARLV